MTLKKAFWIFVPLIVIVALVGWRFSQKNAQEKLLAGQAGQGRPGGGAPGGPAGGGAGGGGGGQSPAVEVAVAGPQTIVENLEAVGTAESPFRVEISPKTSGRIEYLQVREGDVVKPGQVLVRIDPSELEAAVTQQQANVAETRSRLAQAQLNQGPTEVGVRSQIQQQGAGLSSAQADLNQVQRNYDSQVAAADSAVTDWDGRVRSAVAQAENAQSVIEREKASLTNAETKLNRIDSLYRQGFIAAQELDDARTAVDVQKKAVAVAEGQLRAANSAVTSAQSQRDAAKNQAAIARRKGQADIASAKARVTQAKASVNVAAANKAQTPAFRQNLAALEATVRAAEAQLQQARARLSETNLTSPIAGTVTARSADPGALASPGQPVLVVQSLDWLYVTSTVPVEQSASVIVGRPVEIVFDAIQGKTFTGTISNVNPAADLQSRKISFRVKLDNSDHMVKPGMFGRVNIPTKRIAAAVTVPRDAVKTDNGGKTTVTVINKEMAAEVRDVQVGASDAKITQITEGVTAGEQVVTLTFRPVRDGQKVKIGQDEPGKGKGKGGGGGGRGQGGGSAPAGRPQ